MQGDARNQNVSLDRVLETAHVSSLHPDWREELRERELALEAGDMKLHRWEEIDRDLKRKYPSDG